MCRLGLPFVQRRALPCLCVLAEGGGFEPPVRLKTVQRFSKPPPSATRPPLHKTNQKYLFGASTTVNEASKTKTALPHGINPRNPKGEPFQHDRPAYSQPRNKCAQLRQTTAGSPALPGIQRIICFGGIYSACSSKKAGKKNKLVRSY